MTFFRRLILAAFALASVAAHAQFTSGQVLTASQLNIALAAPTITGGSINGAPIGQTTAAAGKFTALSASGAVLFPLAGATTSVSLFGETAGTQYVSGGLLSISDSTSHAGRGHSGYTFASTPIGTGAIGPTNADFAFTASVLKQNFAGSPTAGEIDAGYFVARNGGSNSDTTGFLVDVGNYGTGFNALFEGNTTGFTGGSITQMVNNQAGVVDTRTGNQYGYVVQKTTGTGGIAYYAAQGSGAWQHLLQFVGSSAIRFDMPIDGSNVVSMKLYDSSSGSKTIGVTSNSLTVKNAAGSSTILSADDSGNLTSSGTVTPTGGIAGVTSGGAAAAGTVGEMLSYTAGATVSLTSGTAKTCASLSLTAGDWDVWANTQYTPSGIMTVLNTSISTTANTQNAQTATALSLSFSSGQGQAIDTPITPVNVSSTTTVYAIGAASFSGTVSCTAYIYARRRR